MESGTGEPPTATALEAIAAPAIKTVHKIAERITGWERMTLHLEEIISGSIAKFHFAHGMIA